MMGEGIDEFILLSSSWVFVVHFYDRDILGLSKDEEAQNPWDYEALFSRYILLWDIYLL